LNGWVHIDGAHRFTAEDGAIVGLTVESSATMNSFLCMLPEFDDFELEFDTWIDPQLRVAAGRVNGPQVEIRRSYKGLPATGHIDGEAMSRQTPAPGSRRAGRS
jgi:hypothetical protein